jgi:hypothetical protein
MTVVESCQLRVTKDCDRFVDRQFANGQCFFEVVDTKPVRNLACDGRYALDAVAIGIRFNNRHHSGTTSHNGAKRFELPFIAAASISIQDSIAIFYSTDAWRH